MDVLVLDIGGTTVKMLATDADGPPPFESGEEHDAGGDRR